MGSPASSELRAPNAGVQVLVGDTAQRTLVARIQANGWGRMTTTKVNPFPNEPWGFDNGAFGAWCAGKAFPEAAFMRRLERDLEDELTPFLAVLPDIVAGGQKSLEFSYKWWQQLRKIDWPWYIAVQDGMDPHLVQEVADEIDAAGIFLGGSDSFKQTALVWREVADDLAIPLHYGRAGTPRKVRYALHARADSLDSAFPLWSLDRFDAFERFLMEPDPQRDWLL